VSCFVVSSVEVQIHYGGAVNEIILHYPHEHDKPYRLRADDPEIAKRWGLLLQSRLKAIQQSNGSGRRVSLKTTSTTNDSGKF